MPRNTFTYGQLLSADFDMYITGAGVYNTPARRYAKYGVQGRNGDLIFNENEEEAVFSNVDLRYPAIIVDDYVENRKAISSALSSTLGYDRLTDTFEPNRFRLAVFKGISSPKMTSDMLTGSFEVVFDCKPQWFLLSGTTAVEFNADGTLENPTMQYSKPQIKIYGNGTVGLNGGSITVVNNENTFVVVDSEIEDCYTGSVNRNGDVTLTGGKYPMLRPGVNNITLDGVTCDITPNWYEI